MQGVLSLVKFADAFTKVMLLLHLTAGNVRKLTRLSKRVPYLHCSYVLLTPMLHVKRVQAYHPKHDMLPILLRSSMSVVC